MSHVVTPPGTTLSTPSPTERSSDHFSTEMASRAEPIYLIVATAMNPRLGIGIRGKLPWGPISSDMAFFRKASTGKDQGSSATAGVLNKVIMGRKTWESIPPKFRPLSGRVNIIVTRSDTKTLARSILQELQTKSSKATSSARPGASTPRELELDERSAPGCVSINEKTIAQPMVVVTNFLGQAIEVESADSFCIGGAELYSLILQDRGIRNRVRILQTEVRKVDGGAFECDTYWPEDFEAASSGWREVQKEEIKTWTGLDVPQGEKDWFVDEKAGAEIRVRGWLLSAA